MEGTGGIEREFEEAKEKLLKTTSITQAQQVLGAMREVLSELQEAGHRVSLDVRPAGVNARLATGELALDGIDMSFVISKHKTYSSGLSVEISLEGHEAYSFNVWSNDAGFKKNFRAAMIDIRAERDLFSEHALNPDGISRLPAVKPGKPKLSA